MLTVDTIFEAISSCQLLYPDPELSSDSAEEEVNNMPSTGEYFTTAEGLQHLSVEGESVLSHLEGILQVHTGNQENGEAFEL